MHTLLSLLLVTNTQAAGPEVWAALYNGRLIASVDRDPAAAVAVYEALLTHLPNDDPLRGEILYWLGRGRFELGDTDGAVSALQKSLEVDERRDDARRFLGSIEMHRREVTSLPLRVTPTPSAPGPWVRGWTRGAAADLTVIAGEPPLLRWQTTVRPGDDDFIAVPFAEGTPVPRQIRLAIRAVSFDAEIQLILHDAGGRTWASPIETISTEHWQTLTWETGDFELEGLPPVQVGPAPKDVRALWVRDATALWSRARGDNTLLIREFSAQ